MKTVDMIADNLVSHDIICFHFSLSLVSWQMMSFPCLSPPEIDLPSVGVNVVSREDRNLQSHSSNLLIDCPSETGANRVSATRRAFSFLLLLGLVVILSHLTSVVNIHP